MGQKVHPGGFRVGVIHDWKSNWFNEREFADYLRRHATADSDVGSAELTVKRRLRERHHTDRRDLEEPSGVARRRFPQVVERLDGDDRDAYPPAGEVPSGDQSVPAVVALAADDHGAPAVTTAHDVDRGARDRTPRAFHQEAGGDAERLRLPVERSRLIGREDGLHPPTATANATAFVFSCVNVTRTLVTPSMSARRFALPSSTMEGAPLGWRLTWMSCQRLPR